MYVVIAIDFWRLRGKMDLGWCVVDTISEIEAISSFIKDYAVEIEPELKGKKLDLKIELNPDTYVEVISPDMFKPLRYLDGKTLGIRNRARGKILDELKHHFKDVNALGENPWVIVVDLSRSEISVDFIEDALMGSEQFTLFLNKEKGEVVGQSLSRKKDSVHDINASINILSAVICYKTKLGTDGNFHREGKIVTNSHAKNPLSEESKEKIRISFLR
jgi:hypothetical protein